MCIRDSPWIRHCSYSNKMTITLSHIAIFSSILHQNERVRRVCTKFHICQWQMWVLILTSSNWNHKFCHRFHLVVYFEFAILAFFTTPKVFSWQLKTFFFHGHKYMILWLGRNTNFKITIFKKMVSKFKNILKSWLSKFWI